LLRNWRSVGLNFEAPVKKGLLRIQASRPTLLGLEQHLLAVQKTVEEFDPQAVIFDPVTNLTTIGTPLEVNLMLTRIMDYLKTRGATCFFTALTCGGEALEATAVGVSSLVDTWLLLRDIESNGERNRGIYVLKSRGMPHSNQIREFQMTDQGIVLKDAYLGPSGVLFGSARLALEAQEKANEALRRDTLQRKRTLLERKRQDLESHIERLRREFEAEAEEASQVIREHELRELTLQQDRTVMAQVRHAGHLSPQAAEKE